MTNKALFDAKKIIAQIVTDVVNLEDINFTVPEIQTLLDGITVGGHKLQDELIALNQIKAWKFLFSIRLNQALAKALRLMPMNHKQLDLKPSLKHVLLVVV